MPKRLPFGRKKNPGSHSDAVAGDSRPNSSRRTRTKTTPETTAIIVTATSGNVHLCHQNDHHRRSTAVATEKNAAVTGRVAAAAPGAKFVRVVRALLHWLPPHHAVAATVTATEPLGGQAVEEEDPVIKVEGGQPREREWAPRTALDFSGHSFAKSLQVEIGRTRSQQQQQEPETISEVASSDEFSLPKLVTQRWQQQQQQQQQPTIFDIPKDCCDLWYPDGGAGSKQKNSAKSDAAVPSSSSGSSWGGGGISSSADRGRWKGEDDVVGDSSWRLSISSSSASTLPPSPVAGAVTTTADAAGVFSQPRQSELPPLVPKTGATRSGIMISGNSKKNRCTPRKRRQSRAV